MGEGAGVTEEDLRSILHEQVATVGAHRGRLEQVHRRVGARRRRRAGLVAAFASTAVVVAVVASSTTGPTTPTTQRRSAPATIGAADTLPAYLRGGRLVASIDERTPTAATLTFVPTSLDFGIVDGCSWDNAPAGQRPAAQVTINGKPYEGSGCGAEGEPLGWGGDGDMARPGVDFARQFGVQVGRPVLIRFGWDAGTVRPGSRFRIGVYQGVPLDQYPFPPRPAKLVPVSLVAGFGLGDATVLVVQGSTADPNQAVSRTIQLPRSLEIVGNAVEPGQVSVLVNGRQVVQARTWDYTSQSFGASFDLAALGLKPGQRAVITVRPARYTGATWIVALLQSAA